MKYLKRLIAQLNRLGHSKTVDEKVVEIYQTNPDPATARLAFQDYCKTLSTTHHRAAAQKTWNDLRSGLWQP